jgi:hypothetical protein
VLKKTITYKGTDGNTEYTEDFYFHLSKAELLELEASYDGGLEKFIERIVKSNDNAAIVAEFKRLILLAYGQRTEDGKRFIKNQTLRDEFASTEAYSNLFIELCSDADVAAEFVNGIVPEGLEADMDKLLAKQEQLRPATPETSRNVFEGSNTVQVRTLSKTEAIEMDGDELQSGLASGRFVIAQDDLPM